MVSTANGSQPYDVDYAILAAPPAVLQDIKLTLDPSGLIAQSCSIQTANLIKAFIPIYDSFWQAIQVAHLAPTGMTDKIGMFWEGTDNQQNVGPNNRILSVFAASVAAENAIPNRQDADAYYGTLFAQIYGAWRPRENEHVLFENWPGTDHNRVGYSCPKINDLKIVRLLNELYMQRVAFAGEHTSVPFWGFMEGVLQSGILAVDRLCRG